VTAYGLWDAQNLWGSGNAAFLRGWQSDYSVITRGWPFAGLPSPTSTRNSEQIGLTSVPGGTAGRASTLGGNGLAISRTSAHPREALELIRFLLQGDAQLANGKEHSAPTAEIELYELPEMLDPYPQLAKFKQRGAGLVARPSIVAGEKYEEVSRAYIGAVRSVLTGEKIPSVAAADLEKQLVEITGFTPGLPSKLH
jgi:trehalose/maltose transport system substrate-binding protein